MRTVTEYAFAVGDDRIGPWRADRAAAELDALRHGHATRDPFDRSIVFVAVPADIVTREVEPPMEDNVIYLDNGRSRPPLRLVV